MADEIITLAVYSNVIEAQLARNRLVAEGITAELDSDNCGGLLPGMEITFGNFRLLVPEAEAERASRILGFAEEQPSEPKPNTDHVPATTAIREKQVGSLQEPSRQEPASEERVQRGSEEKLDTTALPEDEDLEEKLNRRLTWTAEELAGRAFRTAVVGLSLSSPALVSGIQMSFGPPTMGSVCCFPTVIGVALNVYSVVLLVRLSALPEEVSGMAVFKMYAASAINVVVLICVLLLVRVILFG